MGISFRPDQRADDTARGAKYGSRPSLRRATLFVLTALFATLFGMLGDGSAHARVPVTHPESRGTGVHAASRTHPAGLAYVGSHGHLYVSNLTGSRRHQLTFGSRGAGMPRWGPFGNKILYVRSGQGLANELWLIRADGRHNHLLRAFNARRLIRDVAWAPGGGRIALVMNIAKHDGEDPPYEDLFIYTPRTNTLTRLFVNTLSGDHQTVPWTLDWSHDGRLIAFSSWDNPEDVYAIAPNGRGLHRVISTPLRPELNPRWGPGDNRFLFSRGGDGSMCSPWIVNAAADGTDESRVVGACDTRLANWSPNGRRIVINKVDRHHARVIWTMALDGTAREFIALGGWASYRPLS